MAETFASSTKGSTLVIVGRNRASAEKLFSSLRESGSDGQYEFVECDATLMKNVKKAANDILSRHPKINYLVFSQGYLTLDGYTPTAEGIDKKLALNYYSRFRFVHDILPALRRGQDEDGVGKVMSVLGPGRGGSIDGFVDDMGLKENYSTTNAKNATPTYNDLMMEVRACPAVSWLSMSSPYCQKFASENPKLSFVHIFPGVVSTNMLSSSNNPLLSISGKVLMPLLKPFMTSPADCAQYMWYALHTNNGGAFRAGSKGEDMGKVGYFGNREQMEKLWQHSKTTTDVD